MVHRCALVIQRQHACITDVQVFVALKFGFGSVVLDGFVHFEFTGGACGFFLRIHRGVKARAVHVVTAFAANITRQIERETKGVMQFECNIARQRATRRQSRQFGVENVHAVGNGLEESLFFQLQSLRDRALFGGQIRVGLAHFLDQRCDQLVEKRCAHAEFVTMANRAANDAAQDIATAFVARNHAVADEERARTDVVGNHAQRWVVRIGAAGFARSGVDQIGKQVNLIVRMHALQNRSQTLQAHAGIHARRRQFYHRAILFHIKLHEYVVPNFDEAVAILVRRTRRAARDVRTVIVENLTARTTWTGVGHHPEIVRFVFAAFIIANANHALRRQTDDLRPDVVGFIIVDVHRRQQALRRKAIDFSQQLPAPFDALFFEIVAKRPITQHFKKGMVTRGVAHVFQIIVLATRTQTRLYRGRAVVRAFVDAEEYVLELNHTGVREHQRWIVGWNQRR